jgi:hypothetical protein
MGSASSPLASRPIIVEQNRELAGTGILLSRCGGSLAVQLLRSPGSHMSLPI